MGRAVLSGTDMDTLKRLRIYKDAKQGMQVNDIHITSYYPIHEVLTTVTCSEGRRLQES
jgi:hypothetical protein